MEQFVGQQTASSSIQLSATGRLPGYHIYVLWVQNPPLPWPTHAGQTTWPECDLHTTVSNRWPHNEYSCCSHPLLFVQASHTPVVKVRLVVWRSDLTGQGGKRLWHYYVGLKRNMREPMKKSLWFEQIQVISNRGISKYFFVSYYSLWTNYIQKLGIDCICIIFEYTVHVPASKVVIFSLD